MSVTIASPSRIEGESVMVDNLPDPAQVNEEQMRIALRERELATAEALKLAATPQGSFSFRIESVKIDFEGEEPPEVEKVAVSFALRVPEGGAVPSWWTAPPAALATVDPATGKAKFGGCHAAGKTARFSLTEKVLSSFLAVDLVVSVHRCSADAVSLGPSDPVLGSPVVVPLTRLVVEDLPEVSVTLALDPGLGAGLGLSSVSVVVSCDDDLTDFALGGTVLTCNQVVLSQPPSSFVNAPSDGSTPSFSAAFRAGVPIPGVEFGVGSLVWDKEAGLRTITFAQPPPVFLTRSSKAALTKALQDDDPPLELLVTRKVKGGASEPAWSLALQLNLGRLLEEGASFAEAQVMVVPGPLPQKPDLPTGNDKQSRSQASQLQAKHAALVSERAAALGAALAGEANDDSSVRSGGSLGKKVAMSKEGNGGGPFVCTASVALSSVLQRSTRDMVLLGLTADDVVPPRREKPAKPPRDFEDELRIELSHMVRTVAEEYESLYPKQSESLRVSPNSSPNSSPSAVGGGARVRSLGGGNSGGSGGGGGGAGQQKKAEQAKELLEVLTSAGVFHDFMEQLKPRVQRVVLAKFGQAPAEPEDLDRYLTQLYSMLMHLTAELVEAHFAPEAAREQAEQQPALAVRGERQNSFTKAKQKRLVSRHDEKVLGEVQERLEELRIWATDAEAIGDWRGAMTKNEDRVTEAVKALSSSSESHQKAVAEAWFLFGKFCLRAAPHMPPPRSHRMMQHHADVHVPSSPTSSNPNSPNSSSAAAVAAANNTAATAAAAAAAAAMGGVLHNELVCKAAESLQSCVACDSSHVEASKLLAAVLLEQGRFEKSQVVLDKALELETPSLGASSSGTTNALASRTEEQLSEPSPLTNVLMCLQLKATGQPVLAQQYLGHAMKGHLAQGLPSPGKPKRTAVVVAIQAAEYLTEASLPGLAVMAMDLAAKAEGAAIAKAAGLGKKSSPPLQWGPAARAQAAEAMAKVEAENQVGAEPVSIKQQRLRAGALLALLEHDPAQALPLAQQAAALGDQDPAAWTALGDAHSWLKVGGSSGSGSSGSGGSGNNNNRAGGGGGGSTDDDSTTTAAVVKQEPGQAATAYAKAVVLFDAEKKVPPLRTLVRLGNLYLQLGMFKKAKELFVKGATAWQTCSMWLGAGIALMRLEEWGNAEFALQEALVRNNNNALAWGYSSLLCLHAGEGRIDQANRAREVAEHLDLDDPSLLRELGNAYTSLDRLETAEALFRRSLALDDTNSHTRRRLADALSAQNAVADAVSEYLNVIAGFRLAYSRQGGLVGAEEREECLSALSSCERLLKTLGRADEIPSLRAFKKEVKALVT